MFYLWPVKFFFCNNVFSLNNLVCRKPKFNLCVLYISLLCLAVCFRPPRKFNEKCPFSIYLETRKEFILLAHKKTNSLLAFHWLTVAKSKLTSLLVIMLNNPLQLVKLYLCFWHVLICMLGVPCRTSLHKS